jgi:acyl carrier protein
MDRQTIEQKVFEHTANAYKEPISNITLDSRFVEDLQGKSLMAFKLVYLLQDEFGIKMEMSRVFKNETVGDAVDLIVELLEVK